VVVRVVESTAALSGAPKAEVVATVAVVAMVTGREAERAVMTEVAAMVVAWAAVARAVVMVVVKEAVE
jgi:hypothetical protein